MYGAVPTSLDLCRMWYPPAPSCADLQSNQGELMLVGLARHGGIEVAGCSDLLTYTAFEAQAGWWGGSKQTRCAILISTEVSPCIQGPVRPGRMGVHGFDPPTHVRAEGHSVFGPPLTHPLDM